MKKPNPILAMLDRENNRLEKQVKKSNALIRLEELRGEIEDECISYGEILELQSLVEYIDKSDVQLLEWAGVKETH